MEFTKMAINTGRPEIPEGAQKEAALIFHQEIVSKVEKYHTQLTDIEYQPNVF